MDRTNFYGTIKITPKNETSPFEITADWTYKSEHDCWYGNGASYPAEICEIVKRKQPDRIEGIRKRLEEGRPPATADIRYLASEIERIREGK